MALTKDPFRVIERTPPSGGSEPPLSRLRSRLAPLEESRIALDETAKSLRRTSVTLFQTRPLTGRPDTDAAVAATLGAFPAALARITAQLGHGGRRRAPGRGGPAMPGKAGAVSRAATPAQAVAGGMASLQRLGMRARLYADELLRAQTELVELESEGLRPLAVLLWEFGRHCDTLSYNLQPAQYQMEQALTGVDAIGADRGVLAHFTRSDGGGYTAVYADPDAVETFLAEHPEHRAAFATHVTRATEAYAQAETSRDQLAEDLELILARVGEV